MVERGEGAVLNVASTAGFQPLARQGTYSASKAFVLSFTEVLSSDLKGTGVTATALCPGPVKTEFTDQHEGFDPASSTPDFIWMSAEELRADGAQGPRARQARGRARRGQPDRHARRASTRRAASCFAAARRFYPLGK